MKLITAALAAAGCMTAWPACAGQAVDEAMQRAKLAPDNEASGENRVSTGLLGAYPASREASGTSWQPDSTRNGGARGSGLRAPDADITRGALGAATVGLQTSASNYPFDRAAAYPGLSGRDPALLGSGAAATARLQEVAAWYSLPVNGHSSVFGYIGLPGEPALGPPVSYMRRLSGIDGPNSGGASHWLDSSGIGSTVFTAGYAWRALKLEGSAFSGKGQDDRNPPEVDKLKLDSTSTRLSYNPSPNWSFQFSRGAVSGLDQLEPNEEIRRVTISATYNRALSNGNWQSTLAWGRNARTSSEPTMGYLLESTLHVGGAHAVFGRLEQVGGGEQAPENGTARSQTFKRNRLTFGYFHEIGAHGPVRLDAGAFVSRYFVPPSASAAYGSDTTSFMLFVRLNMR